MSQKEIVSWLDRAAARADMIDRTPATGKQCWFLAKLMADNAAEVDLSELVLNTNLVLTKREASNRISFYLGN